MSRGLTSGRGSDQRLSNNSDAIQFHREPDVVPGSDKTVEGVISEMFTMFYTNVGTHREARGTYE